jgi:hypothetical protein
VHARSQSESRCADPHILLVLQQLRGRLRSPVSSGNGHAVVERLPQGAFWFPGIRALIRRFFSSPIGYTSAEREAARAKRGLPMRSTHVLALPQTFVVSTARAGVRRDEASNGIRASCYTVREYLPLS